MSQHTPGPWKRCGGMTAPYIAIIDPDGRYIINSFSDNIPDDESRANARLIATAPELLDALIQLREWVREPWGEDDSPANEQVIDAADAAIARAS